MELQWKVAQTIADHADVDRSPIDVALATADAILQIPEIRDALEAAQHWSEGVELPPELVERMGRVYGSRPLTIRVTDDEALERVVRLAQATEEYVRDYGAPNAPDTPQRR